METRDRLVDDFGQVLSDLKKILAIPIKKDVKIYYEDARTLAFLRALERFQILVKNMAGQAGRLSVQDILKVFSGLVNQDQASVILSMFGALGNLSIDRDWYSPEEAIHYDKYIDLIPEYTQDLEALYTYICTYYPPSTKEMIYESH